MVLLLLVVLGWTNVGGQFVSDFLEEGDYQSVFHKVSLGFHLRDDAHVLPYLFGFLENLDFPKDRTILDIYVEDSADATLDKVKWWLKQVNWLYVSTRLTVNELNWREEALTRARISRSDYVLLFEGDHFFINTRVIQHLMDRTELAVAPLLFSIFEDTVHSPSKKYEGDIQELDSFEIKDVAEPIFIDLNHPDASYVTFSSDNLFLYDDEVQTQPLDVFLTSLRRMDSFMHLDYQHFYGYNLSSSGYFLDYRKKLVNYFVANLVSNDGTKSEEVSGYMISSFVKPQYPKPSSYGMDKIYVINLARRQKRRVKMAKIMKLLGFDYQLWNATDGQSLAEESLFKDVVVLPGYEDPFSKRPIKAGEIGCFLSHYRIWKEVVEKQLERVIVFEDDLRFDLNGTARLREMVEDLDTTDIEWDLIYLGRKPLEAKQEHWVPGHRYLSTVGYSYWTIGYMLSQNGAQKLLKGDPLKKLLPVDEYIPIMFDRHPNTTWKEAFAGRDLVAFTVYPAIVTPESYTHEEGYLSDTESSDIVFASDVSVDFDSVTLTTEDGQSVSVPIDSLVGAREEL